MTNEIILPLAFTEQRKWTRLTILGLGSILILSNLVAFFISSNWYRYLQCVEFMYMAMELYYFFQYHVFSWWLIFGIRMTFCFCDFMLLVSGHRLWGSFLGILLTNLFGGIAMIVLYSRLWAKSCWNAEPLDQQRSSVSTVIQDAENSIFSQKTRCARGFIPPLSTMMACSDALIIGLIVYLNQTVKSKHDLFIPMLVFFVLFLTYEVCEFVYFFWFKAFSWWTTLFMRVSMLVVNATWLGIVGASLGSCPTYSYCPELSVVILTFLGLSFLLQLSCIACYWKIRRSVNTVVSRSYVNQNHVSCEENATQEATDEVATEN